MLLAIECLILCAVFTAMILPRQFRDPVSMIMSYPPKIRKRVEGLPRYAGTINDKKKNHVHRKIGAIAAAVIVFSAIAYVSGARSFDTVFFHVFILFFAVNIYDMLVLDLGIFCHSKRVIIPGTEDMVDEYRNPWHHVKGALVGTAFGVIVALFSGGVVVLYKLVIGI